MNYSKRKGTCNFYPLHPWSLFAVLWVSAQHLLFLWHFTISNLILSNNTSIFDSYCTSITNTNRLIQLMLRIVKQNKL